MVQWLRIHLAVQGTEVQSLVWKDLTCLGAAKPVHRTTKAKLESLCAPTAAAHVLEPVPHSRRSQRSTAGEASTVRSPCTAAGE